MLYHRASQNTSIDTLLHLYESMVRPHLEFASQVWDPYLQNALPPYLFCNWLATVWNLSVAMVWLWTIEVENALSSSGQVSWYNGSDREIQMSIIARAQVCLLHMVLELGNDMQMMSLLLVILAQKLASKRLWLKQCLCMQLPLMLRFGSSLASLCLGLLDFIIS